MGVRQAVARTLLSWAGMDLRDNSFLSLLPPSDRGVAQWKSWKTETAVKEGYKAHPVVYRCVYLIKAMVGAVPWVARSGDDLVETGPIHEFLKRPSDMWGFGEIVGQTVLYRKLGGDAYWHINKLPEGAVVNLRRAEVMVLRPDRVKPKPTKDQILYDYDGGAASETFQQDQIVHFCQFDPNADYTGLSDLQAAGRLVDSATAAIDWNKKAIEDSRYIPDWVLSVGQELTADQYEHLRAQYDARTGSQDGRRGLIVMGADMKFEKGATTPTEMDFNASLERVNREIALVFGVSPHILGIGDTTYENFNAGMRALWTLTLIPELRAIRDTLNAQLAPQFGDFEFEFDLSQTQAVVWARREAAEEARHYFAMGVSPRVINERLGLGFEPDDLPEKGYLPVNMIEVGATVGEGRQVRSINLETDEQKVAHWRAIDREKQMWERKVNAMVGEVFAAEGPKVAAQIEAGKSPAIDEEPWRDLFQAAWETIVEHFGERVEDDIGRGAAPREKRFDPYQDEVAFYIESHVAESVAEVGDATKEFIRQRVEAGMAEGKTRREIAKSIREMYDEWRGPFLTPGKEGVKRSLRIARTEVHSASGYGQWAAATQSGVVRTHTWLNSMDDRVRESHQFSQTVPIDEPYSLPSGASMMFPGDPAGGPEEVIQCRCTEIFGTR